MGLVMPAEVRFLHILVETLAFRCGILQYLARSKKLNVSGGVKWCTYIHRGPPIAGTSGVIGNKTKMVNAAEGVVLHRAACIDVENDDPENVTK